jgi:hypothetical protein
MSSTLAPFGMRPLFHPTGLDRAQNMIGAIVSGHAFNLFKFAPVALNTSGLIIPDSSTTDFIGVFAGVQYPDSLGRPTFSNNWVSGTVTGTGPIWVFVWTTPDIVYEVQANGSVVQAALGDQANFSATAGQTQTSGSTLTGLSTCAISSTLAGAGVQGKVRIYDLQRRPDNDWGDTYTIVQVQIAQHQYVSDKLAI